MWSLFNISDTKTLTLYDLEKGVTTVTQSEELFDCLPAVRAAFHYTKVFFNNGIDEEEEAEKKAKEEEAQKEKNGKKEDLEEVIKAPLPKVEKTLEFPEFRMFLQSLRQYYLYCQVSSIYEEILCSADWYNKCKMYHWCNSPSNIYDYLTTIYKLLWSICLLHVCVWFSLRNFLN